MWPISLKDTVTEQVQEMYQSLVSIQTQEKTIKQTQHTKKYIYIIYKCDQAGKKIQCIQWLSKR